MLDRNIFKKERDFWGACLQIHVTLREPGKLSSVKHVRKIFRKTNISNPLIRNFKPPNLGIKKAVNMKYFSNIYISIIIESTFSEYDQRHI